MTAVAALLRARLGAALRALPSELLADRTTRAPRRSRTPDEIPALAGELERVSPGLALMMQLRARVFDDAVRAAGRRGFARLIAVGCGFDDRRLRRLAREHPCVVEVEHPAVLAAKATRRATGSVTQVPVDDFARDAWHALRQRIVVREGTSFLLLQGLSLWGGADALAEWLDRLAHETAVGSEMLLNVMDDATMAETSDAVPEVRCRDGTAALTVQFGIVPARLRDEIAVRKLRLLRSFDSSDVQRRYLGVENLLVRELFVWLGTGRDQAGGVESPAPLPMPVRRGYRPRLGGDLEIHWAGVPPAIVKRRITELRDCRLALSVRTVAVASLFDGTRSVDAVAAMLHASGTSLTIEDVAEAVGVLRTHGALAYAGNAQRSFESHAVGRADGPEALEALHRAAFRHPGHLGALRELAFIALERSDARLARRVGRRLVSFAGNCAADHLRYALQRCGSHSDVRLARCGRVAVLCGADMAAEDARAILADAQDLLVAVARLLDIHFAENALVDVSTARQGLPVTMVSAAEPYTLIAIPRPLYSRALLCHELTHVLAMSGSAWLSEGLAVWIQRRVAPGVCFPDDGPSATADADRAPLERKLTRELRPLGEMPRRLARADYVEAADFVEFVVGRAGFAIFRKLFGACRVPIDVAALNEACRELGVSSIAGLEREWRGSVR